MAVDLSKLQELRKRIFFVIGALIVYRIGTFIPVPGVNPAIMSAIFDQQSGTILDVFNMFSGGALERMSLFALGIMPYISASIIMQLLTVTVPTLEQMKKEGEAGRRKITTYTRYGTVVLALFQSMGVANMLLSQTHQGSPLVYIDSTLSFYVIAISSLVTGTVFLMWLGEQISERGIGNGISIIIFAGIVAGLPAAIGGTAELVRTGELSALIAIILFILALAVTAFVIFVERGQRRITVNYAKRQQGRKMYAAQSSHLPLKLSIILFPATLGGWFGQTQGLEWLADISTALSPGQPIYVAFYAAAIIFFCFFYTALVFNSRETADNLKKSGAFIPGIRGVMTRLTLVGAFYITSVCLLPEFLILYWNVPFYFGGTSLLIIVVVVMDFMAQMQSHMMSQNT